jgi:hypothetical protein
MEGLAWEDEEPLLADHSKVGVYTKELEDKGMVYWFPTLMAQKGSS